MRQLLLRHPTGPLPLGDFLRAVEGRGFGLLLMLLALPSALPVPAPGYSVPFGLLIAILAAQMLAGRKMPWLPTRVHQWTLRRRLAESMTNAAEKLFGRVEFLVKPRLAYFAMGHAARVLQGGLVLCMALLMCLPIPLTNTAPAMVIFLIGIGISENDGVFTLLACALGMLAALLYALVVALAVHLVWLHGPAGLEQLKDTLRTWLQASTG